MNKEFINTLTELMNIESVQGEPLPDAPFGEWPRRALDFMLSLGKKLGFRTYDVDGYAGEIEFGGGEETVGVLAHLDIIPTGGGWTKKHGEIADGKLYGRGVVDDKGPALVCLYAMKELMDSNEPLKRKVRLILGCNEESGNKCMDYYVENRPLPDISFSPDAEFPVITYEKEINWFTLTVPATELKGVKKIRAGARPNVVAAHAEVTFMDGTVKTFEGRAAHAMEPHKGDNAIFKLLNYLAETGVTSAGITAAAKYFAAPDYLKRLGIERTDADSGPQSFNLGKLEYDEGGPLVFTLDSRNPSGQTGAEVIQKVVSVMPEGSKAEVFYRENALQADENGFLVKTLKSIYEKNTGNKAYGIIIGGGTYARKIPNCVGYGPLYDGQACGVHDADEFLPLEQLDLIYKIYKEAIYELAK